MAESSLKDVKHCLNTDVSCIYYWFDRYKEVLRRRYGINDS